MTMSLEEVLEHLWHEELALALRQLGLADSGTKAVRVTRLLDFAERRESQGADGILDALEALGPDPLRRVCFGLGIETGDKAHMVERIDDRIEVVRRTESANRVREPNRIAPPRPESPSPTTVEASLHRPSHAGSWKRFLYPAIGVVLGLLVGGIANAILRNVMVTLSGAESINDISEGWRSIRSVAYVAVGLSCEFIGFRFGSKLASAE